MVIISMNYDISALIDASSDIELQPIVGNFAAEREYKSVLREILREAGKSIDDDLLPAYRLTITDGALVNDAIFATAKELVARTVERLQAATQSAILKAEVIISGESTSLDNKWIAAIKRASGLDVSPYINPADNAELIQSIVERNTALINDLSDQTRSRITQLVVDAQINRKSSAVLRSEIRNLLNDTQRKRADLIALDQMNKLSAEIIASRAKQAGMNIYIWRSKMDGRERAKHHRLHNTRQDASKPNHGDNGQYPRQPIRCRCNARWVIRAGKKK